MDSSQLLQHSFMAEIVCLRDSSPRTIDLPATAWVEQLRKTRRPTLRAEIRGFINQQVQCYLRECSCYACQGADKLYSGRSIACIFQGIASPRYPTDTWKRTPEWGRSCENIWWLGMEHECSARFVCLEFEEVRRVANEELHHAWLRISRDEKVDKASKRRKTI